MEKTTDPAVEQSTTTGQPVEKDTVINDEYDDFEKEIVGLEPPEKTETKTETEVGTETKETEETETKTEIAEPAKTEDEQGTDEVTYPIIVDGTEHKLKMEELIAHARQGFDYTQKTQKLADERKKFEEGKGTFENERNLIMMENLALQVGGEKRKPLLDEMGDMYDNLVEKYGKEDANKLIAQYELVPDKAEYLRKENEYNQWLQGAQTLANNRRIAEEENLKNIDAFKTEHKFDDKAINDMITDMQNYIGYAVGKGQVPFPKDTFEIFYKGKHFNELLKTETDKLNAEWEKKLKDEKEKLIASMKPSKTFVKPASVATKPKTTTDKSAIDEFEEELIIENY